MVLNFQIIFQIHTLNAKGEADANEIGDGIR